jgi:3-hydroxyacyl-CoA dehydrogenase
MSKFQIRRAAVVGAGTMGGGIAALLAGVGIPVTLLDIAAEGSDRNQIVKGGWERVTKSRPPALFLQSDSDLVTLGNLMDDFDQLGQADWIVEAIVENLDLKRDFFARLEKVRKPGSIVSSNTSGLTMRQLIEGRSDDFCRRFIGVHFFNPPRYLHLLELIPTPDTDPTLIEFMRDFGERALGKGVVVCKDTPNFVGNRVGLATIGFRMWYGLENGYTVEEVDTIAGPPLGYPRTAVFRLLDLTGIDVAAYVEKNTAAALPNEPTWNRGKSAAVVRQVLAHKWFGNKTNVGFYREVRGADGQKDFWVLNTETMDHEPPRKPRFDSISATRKIGDLGQRLKAMIAQTDRAAQFAWHDLAFQFAYCSAKIPETFDDLISIDNAMKWGYAHEMGPFEKWDAVGVADTVKRMEADGYHPADWVKEMLSAGHATFYKHSGGTLMQYSPLEMKHVPVRASARAISVASLRLNNREVECNDDASLHDMGDGVALLEYHSPANTYTPQVVVMLEKALERLDSDFDALVIGNDGPLFCAGANLDPQTLMAGGEPPAVMVDRLARNFQNLMQAIRFSPKPIVAAPFDRTLAGGTETCLAAHRIVAAVELHMGLVEVGVGLIPAGGGCKELLRRVMNRVMRIENADPLPVMQQIFMQIGMAKVSANAKEARAMGFLTGSDRFVMNGDHLLGEAKREARHMSDSNFRPPAPEKIYVGGRDLLAAIHMQLLQMVEGKFISEHDHLIAKKLAWVLCGGDLSGPTWVDEQYILDLERQAFVYLIQQPKTQERILHVLTRGKPLRN